MISQGALVEVFEDPLTMKNKEGNAIVLGFVRAIQPNLNQYIVHFQGDAPGFNVVRIVNEDGPICAGTDPVRCDDPECRVHHTTPAAHWAGA